MSSKLLFLAVLLTVVTVAYSLQCYYGQIVNGQTTVPFVSEPCPFSKYCMKIFQTGSYNNIYATYGCGTNQCSSSGCSTNKNGYGTCCCTRDLCNSGFDFSKTTLSSIVQIL
ncbi:UPAR/Ly6 domain-containing protein [Caenorhabditis elegans]|uniref:UPAR/Ly6 domain-containing protein n=1 Tax=Caenorhabditis elegans TaxID=6239 RepID=Q95ZS9_CAEEL|nr:UPAR/Ly6 domain-containing protein [Caenorhabditis elegans]CCD71877.1 UPAR/Ly6 domain-containing protein [Caenorhabditis elegans]|eukprot:NP_495170.1 Uncharacterized protein CELE_F55C12.7 [Caenorhabditis elegans]